MKDLGLISRYLGVQVDSLPDGYFLHQTDYTNQLLRETGMSKCRPLTIPLLEGTVLLTDMSSSKVDTIYYNCVVGKLIYLTNTRPDISYSVGIVSRYMVTPQQSHLDAVLHSLRYLRHTTDYGLLYKQSLTPHLFGFTRAGGPWDLIGFTDVDWGACQEARRSIGAYLFVFGGGPISWSSKR